jgi:SAM-dependent methyltransferase
VNAQDDFWGLGEYTEIAPRLEGIADDLVETANLVYGSRVLDAAAGTGNVAVVAAARGARVLACDSSPAMVEVGQRRTRASHLPVEWRVADVQSLPIPDNAMDAALSALGVMFAPDPERAAAELFRVVRPGGTIAMANWVRTGFVEASTDVLSGYMPASGEGADPLAWGNPDVVSERLGRRGRLELWEREAAWAFADLDEACAWFEHGPPYAWARGALEPERYEELRGRLRSAVERFAEKARHGVVLRPAYLVARVRVR